MDSANERKAEQVARANAMAASFLFSEVGSSRGSSLTFGKTMKEILAPILIGFSGCALFYFRRSVDLAAEKISFPPFFRGDQKARIRLFGMIGIVYALISFGIGGLFWLSNQ